MMVHGSTGIMIPSSSGSTKRSLDQSDTPGRSKRIPGTADFPSLEWQTDSNASSSTNIPSEQLSCLQQHGQPINRPQSPVRSAQRTSSSSAMKSCPPTPQSTVSKQDRFIPNRNTLDSDYNYYLLTKDENEAVDPETGKPLSLLLTPSQRKFNEELNNSLIKSADNGACGGSRKRLVECRTSLTPSFDRSVQGSSSSIADHIQVIRKPNSYNYTILTYYNYREQENPN